MMKVIIIDDELLARSIVREYLERYPDVAIVAECADGFEGMKAILQHEPELIFLDVQMPKINGFEMLELIEKPPAVIFTTAFDEFAIKAFEQNAVDYLLKPFSRDRFDKAIQKFRSQPFSAPVQPLLEAVAASLPAQNRIVVRDANKIKIIPLHQVQYLEAADDYIKIVTAEGAFLKKQTMQSLERSLDPGQFVRTHRSFIVNTQFITRIDTHEKDSHLLLLSTGTRLPVSKPGYSRLREALGI